ncbi:GNAT family N-acetyltransferase [Aspergillus saccharolyticus JOP 1030-1]|uniref:N-acetyltransferase domain-containing protein n=1 Tax=Aspergillus saccharolyticus JOP 1030-1 TaxID=1450539 RepID=A0A318ZBB4_9EURO|nr:hypothetical protein BP01DRAFT_357422 [Aspergillus saccharolyticus JOP 1030-1]PYH44735.1 hypothetical protein BP01DRAFT_357422 [Aspergillus saccharolyticus JOP 1030-1]
MSFILTPCTPADSPQIARAIMLARLTDPHWVFLWTDPNPTRLITDVAARFPYTLVRSRDHTRHQMVSYVDESGEKTIVGYARWTLPDLLLDATHQALAGEANLEKHNAANGGRDVVWPEAQVQAPTEDELREFKERFDAASDGGQVPGMKRDGMVEFRSRPLEEADERVTRGKEFLTLDYLCTHPDFWRRGVGSMLVASGLQVADRCGLRTYVMSEPAGLKVYSKHGFRVVETVSTDYSRFGGQEPQVLYFLVREVGGGV